MCTVVINLLFDNKLLNDKFFNLTGTTETDLNSGRNDGSVIKAPLEPTRVKSPEQVPNL